MPPLFNVQQKGEQGTKNPMSARLTVQVTNLLQACGAEEKLSQEIVVLFTFSILPRLLRCAEIEARIRGHIEKGKTEFKRSSRELLESGSESSSMLKLANSSPSPCRSSVT
jgi:hypothetical protein